MHKSNPTETGLSQSYLNHRHPRAGGDPAATTRAQNHLLDSRLLGNDENEAKFRFSLLLSFLAKRKKEL
jgi:hypothetical protein